MRRASVLIGVAAAVFLTALVQTAGPDLMQTAGVEKAVPGESTDYLGSESCRSCHEDQYASWKFVYLQPDAGKGTLCLARHRRNQWVL